MGGIKSKVLKTVIINILKGLVGDIKLGEKDIKKHINLKNKISEMKNYLDQFYRLHAEEEKTNELKIQKYKLSSWNIERKKILQINKDLTIWRTKSSSVTYL